MQTSQPPVWARDHTIFGVCEALGEDFGFNPLFLRVPLAALLLVNPAAVIGTYAGLGALVLLTRWLVREPRPAATAPAAAAQVADNEDRDLALAA